MPIRLRKGGGVAGASSSRLIRPKDKNNPKQSTSKFVLSGEAKDVMDLWNNEAPGTIHKLGDQLTYGRYATGALALDLALAGGFMRSRASMLYGERSSGKTTMATLTIAEALRLNPDKIAVVIDIEGTYDKAWAAILGVDVERLYVVEPPSGEAAVDLTDAFIRTDNVCAVLIDSIAMITPMVEIDESADKNQIGLQARLIGKMLRRIGNAILQERRRNHHPMLIALNQFRTRMVMFGDPRTLPGGKALEFAMTQQVEMKNKEIKDKSGKVVTHNEHSFIITKDKSGGRFKEGKFKIIRDEDSNGGLPVGFIDQAKTILELGAPVGIVSGRYSVDGISTKFRNEAEFRDFCVENPEKERIVRLKIVAAYLKKWGIDAG